jgi:serine/threonine protein kinase
MSEVTSNVIVDRERRLDEAVALYLREAQAGKPPSREEFLVRYPDLTPELEDFLADEARFEQVAAPLQAVGQALALPPDGALIGDYTLREIIAQGGMGVVYRAEQRSLGRIVALKVLRAGQLADPTERQRFRLEAEAVAHLDHPGIVPVYDVGEQDGWLYFSMKLIEGGSLAGSISQIGWPADNAPRAERQARRAQVLDLMTQVSDAVHYAHQHGVLHRDLKPGNILLDPQRRPHVSDFGLAKCVHGLGGPDTTIPGRLGGPLTEAGAILGTPSYMAPEQASGHPDAVAITADVYSLGAILYELLTGRAPFREATPLATIRALVEREPARPRTLRPSIDRDLETICLKCLEKDPDRRYGTARELADELRRCQRGEPILARPVSTLERAYRWARRNRAAAGLIGLGLTSALGFAGLIAVHVRKLERSEARATSSWSEGDNMIRRTMEKMDTDLEEASGVDPAQREIQQFALNYYDKLIKLVGDVPRFEKSRALVQYRKARTLVSIGSAKEALAAYDRAYSLYRAVLEDEPESPEVLGQLASIHQNIGMLQARLGRIHAAETAYAEAQRLLEHLLAAAPDDVAVLDQLAAVLTSEGQRAYETGRDAAALKLYEKAETLRRRLVQLRNDPYQRNNLAGVCTAKAKLLERDPSRHDEVISSYTEAKELRSRLVGKSEKRIARFRRDLAEVEYYEGNYRRVLGHPKDSVQILEDALDRLAELVAENPQVRQYRRDQAACKRSLAAALKDQGMYGDAHELLKSARTLQEKLIADDPDVLGYRLELARTWNCYGELYARMNQRPQALAAFEHARTLYEDLVPTDPDNVIYRRGLAETLSSYSSVLGQTGQREASDQTRRLGLEHEKQTHPVGAGS